MNNKIEDDEIITTEIELFKINSTLSEISDRLVILCKILEKILKEKHNN